MLLAKLLLTKEIYQNALDEGVNIFLYNEINFTHESKEDIIFFNCTTERVPSTWYTWQKNEEVFKHFKKKYEQFFIWEDYDMTLAFLKALYWSNQKTGFLQYVKSRYFSQIEVWKEDALYDSKFINVLLKYNYFLINRRSQPRKQLKFDNQGKVGLLVRNEFEVILYKFLITQSLNKENVLFFVTDDHTKEVVIKLGAKQSQIVVCKNTIQRKTPFINPLFLKKEDRYILNQILNNWHEVEHWIGVAEEIVSYGVSKVLMNEAENGLIGAVFGEVFHKHGVVSYNTMNGMKAGQAQDSFINFDYWFVWDEKIKQLLIQKNKLPESKLIATGHLMEDKAREHQFHNSLPVSKEDIKGKKVISLFSVRGRREEKLEAFEYIYKLAELNKELIFLIRLHPSENAEDGVLPPKDLKNIYTVNYTDENSKITLYDQLLISDLSICFGSTVALESKWFGVPCITYEKREESLIYLIDEEIIFHVKEANEFIQKVNDLLSVGKKDRPKLMKVADSILEKLLQ